MKSRQNRREFIKNSVVASAGIYLSSFNACSSDIQGKNINSKSKVVIAKNDLIRNSDKSLNADIVYQLLNNAIENYFESTPAKKVWSNLFNKNDTVGIKINCLAGRGISTSHEIVDAIIENLLSVGIPKQNIIVWDRANRDLEKAGYKIQTSSRAVKYYGNDYAGFTGDLYESRSIGSFLSNILVRECSAIINVPVLKDHGIVGLTNALKNFFGAIHNPNKYHSNTGNPFIADVNLIPDIRNKTRLTICDALTAQYEGGPPYMPQWTWQFNGLIIGTDMVALDTIAWEIIEQKRKQNGFSSLRAANREPVYVATAADSEHQLGNHDKNKIEVLNI